MFTETPWDDEVDVLCIGTEGGVLAAGIAAASAGLDVYLGITEPTDGDADLAASLSYGGGDRATTKHLAGFDYAFGKRRAQRPGGRCAQSKTSRRRPARATAVRSNRSSARRSNSGRTGAPPRPTACSTTECATVR